MTLSDERTIANGLFPSGQDVEALTPTGREEVRAAVDALLRVYDRDNARLTLALEQLDRAAAENERLQGELQSVHAHLQHYRDLVDQLRAEIERLEGVIKKEMRCDPRYCTFGNGDGERLRAEIERLRSELEDEEKSVFACMKMCKERDAEIEQLQAHNNRLISHGHDLSEMITERDAQLTEAAAFLDGLAGSLDDLNQFREPPPGLGKAAADCRAMAKKLRGET